MYCKNCGKEVSDDAQFCKYCGTKFISKEKVNGRVIAKEIETEKKVKNKNAIISLVLAIAALIGCMMPFSSFGWLIIVLVAICALLSLFFRLRGKNEMYMIYDSQGLLVGKTMMNMSLCISILCLILALVSITRFI